MVESISETRIKKWQVYRNEIINEGVLVNKIANESAITKRYKEIIDKLNPKILVNANIDQTMAKLISIDENKMLEVKELQKFVELIDDKKLITINDEIGEWLSKYNGLSVIDEKGNISQKWLSEDENYNDISTTQTRIEISANKWATFQFDGKDQLVKLDLLEKNDNTKVIMNSLSTIKSHEEKIAKFSQALYIIPAIASIFFLLVSVILLIIKIGEI